MSRFLFRLLLLSLVIFQSCKVSHHFVPQHKFDRQQLENDYQLLRNTLEKNHPSIYWYTSPDSMKYYFGKYESLIEDSMTENDFQWKVLSPLLNKIHCGHTSVIMSKASSDWYKNRKLATFPFHLKVWNDTMAVMESLPKNDSVFKRGVILTSINGISSRQLTSDMLGRLSEDGYSHNVNYIRISANFPMLHRYRYGVSPHYNVSYIDSNGKSRDTIVPAYKPEKDSSINKDTTSIRKAKIKTPGKLEKYRSLTIDSSGFFAVMHLNSFSKGKLRTFYRKSFRTLRKKNIKHLVVDVRINGGGLVKRSTLLTKYLIDTSFRVADSVYSITRKLGSNRKYFKGKIWNEIGLKLMTKKYNDGKYHIRRYEKHFYHPKKKNNYNGKAYILISGPTFSASCMAVNALKGQDNITVIGEETGGGWYGNSGILIPSFTLPHTRLRVRLPLFRVLQYHHQPENKGKGIQPDILVPTSYEALLKGYDKKLQVVKDIILSQQKVSAINH